MNTGVARPTEQDNEPTGPGGDDVDVDASRASNFGVVATRGQSARAAKLKAIAAALKRGAYDVDPWRIAERILSEES